MTQKNGSSESSNLFTTLGANGASETSSNGDIFVALREHVNLADLASEYTELKQSGTALLGRCPHPHHEDNTPSFYIYDDHFHCYGCRWHGDVTDLYRTANDLASNIEAAQRLCKDTGLEVPAVSEETRQIAVQRRERADELRAEAKLLHDALADHPQIVDYWKRRGFDADIQSRYLLGADDGAATIPFWNQDEVHGVIRRNLTSETKYKLAKSEKLLERHRPLFIPGKLGKSICLVEGYVDAIALSVLGFSSVAVGGTGMSGEQRSEMKKIIARHGATIFILPDDDEEGAKAGRRWLTDLYPNARLCLPDYNPKAINEKRMSK